VIPPAEPGHVASDQIANPEVPPDPLDALGNLPSEGGHCAELASNTLMVAISDWRDNNG